LIHNDYRDDLHTTEKAVHNAILKRFDAIDSALTVHTARLNETREEIEAARVYFHNTRIGRALAWLKLI
jgi:hypothetical protein